VETFAKLDNIIKYLNNKMRAILRIHSHPHTNDSQISSPFPKKETDIDDVVVSQ